MQAGFSHGRHAGARRSGAALCGIIALLVSFGGSHAADLAPGRSDAARVEIGKPVDDFSLPDVTSGKSMSLYGDRKQQATVLLFISSECPISGSYDERMRALAQEYAGRGVRFLAVNASASETVKEIAEHAAFSKFPFPVLKDAGNPIADRFQALVTPEAYVIDARGALRYHGRIDDNQKPEKVTSHDLRNALDAVLAGKEPPVPRARAFGCLIDRAKR